MRARAQHRGERGGCEEGVGREGFRVDDADDVPFQEDGRAHLGAHSGVAHVVGRVGRQRADVVVDDGLAAPEQEAAE